MLGLLTPSIHLLCSPFIAIQVLCIPIGYGPTHVSCYLVLEDFGGLWRCFGGEAPLELGASGVGVTWSLFEFKVFLFGEDLSCLEFGGPFEV